MVEPVALSDQSETYCSTDSQISPPLTGSAGMCEREKASSSPRFKVWFEYSGLKLTVRPELKVCHFYNPLGVLV